MGPPHSRVNFNFARRTNDIPVIFLAPASDPCHSHLASDS